MISLRDVGAIDVKAQALVRNLISSLGLAQHRFASIVATGAISKAVSLRMALPDYPANFATVTFR